MYPKYFKHVFLSDQYIIVKFIDSYQGYTIESNNPIYTVSNKLSSWTQHDDDIIWKDVTRQYIDNIYKYDMGA